MGTFASYDGTKLAFHRAGSGEPLVCVPGGPGRASRYFGDLGGLSAHRTLVRLDSRGTGDSAVPADPATYRWHELVADVEALRDHLGLERLDLLGHSAGGTVALAYAARHPDRIRRLVLVTPSTRTIGLVVTDAQALAAIEQNAGQPWYGDARAALLAWQGGDSGRELRLRAAPLFYGQWNDTIAAHAAADDEEKSPAAQAGFISDDGPGPAEMRAALGRVDAPALVVAGALDPSPTPEQAAELAGLFPHGRLEVMPHSAHYPWLTDAAAFVRTVDGFLD